MAVGRTTPSETRLVRKPGKVFHARRHTCSVRLDERETSTTAAIYAMGRFTLLLHVFHSGFRYSVPHLAGALGRYPRNRGDANTLCPEQFVRIPRLHILVPRPSLVFCERL